MVHITLVGPPLTSNSGSAAVCKSHFFSMPTNFNLRACVDVWQARCCRMAQPSVVLATPSYDHTIRFWEAKSGRGYRTVQYPDCKYWLLASRTKLSSLAEILHTVCFL
jgi:hypothetical protein